MNLKRTAVVAAAASLFASTAAIALAQGHDTEADIVETRELSTIQFRMAQLLADYMVGDEDGEEQDEGRAKEDGDAITALDEIIALRTGDTVVGWGAMFKLLQLANATDTPLADLLAEFDEGGWAFGRRFSALSDSQRALLDDTPKNLGQLMKQQKASKENRGKKSRGG